MGQVKDMLRLDDDIQADNAVEMYGISAHVRPYRMCWALNRSLGLQLCREEDQLIRRANGELGFSRYTYQLTDEEVRYTLFQNIRPEGRLVADLKHADFLFMVQYGEDLIPDSHMSRIQQTEFVNTVFSLSMEKWKEMYAALAVDGF